MSNRSPFRSSLAASLKRGEDPKPLLQPPFLIWGTSEIKPERPRVLSPRHSPERMRTADTSSPSGRPASPPARAFSPLVPYVPAAQQTSASFGDEQTEQQAEPSTTYLTQDGEEARSADEQATDKPSYTLHYIGVAQGELGILSRRQPMRPTSPPAAGPPSPPPLASVVEDAYGAARIVGGQFFGKPLHSLGKRSARTRPVKPVQVAVSNTALPAAFHNRPLTAGGFSGFSGYSPPPSPAALLAFSELPASQQLSPRQLQAQGELDEGGRVLREYNDHDEQAGGVGSSGRAHKQEPPRTFTAPTIPSSSNGWALGLASPRSGNGGIGHAHHALPRGASALPHAGSSAGAGGAGRRHTLSARTTRSPERIGAALGPGPRYAVHSGGQGSPPRGAAAMSAAALADVYSLSLNTHHGPRPGTAPTQSGQVSSMSPSSYPHTRYRSGGSAAVAGALAGLQLAAASAPASPSGRSAAGSGRVRVHVLGQPAAL